MLGLVSELLECNIEAIDGKMGKVKDIYIDDQSWTIRYAQIDTWKTLPGRRVLLSPSCFRTIDFKNKLLNIDLDKETVRKSPNFAEKTGLTQETEERLADYYGWTKYWTGNMVWGTGGKAVMNPLDEKRQAEIKDPSISNPLGSVHALRSETEIAKFRVHAANGRLGKIIDMVFDLEKWSIKSFVIQLKYQEKSGLVLISPNEIVSIEWVEGDLYAGETLDELKERPVYRDENEIHEYLPNL